MSIRKFVSTLFFVSIIASLLAACGAPATSAPQMVEVTKIVAGTPVTEIITATPEPTKSLGR